MDPDLTVVLVVADLSGALVVPGLTVVIGALTGLERRVWGVAFDSAGAVARST